MVNELYSALFENNHAVMLLIDPVTGAVMDGNPAACAFYGYSREQLRSKKISDINILAPDEISRRMQMARDERQRCFHFPHRLADGSVRHVEVYSGPVRIHGRQLLYSIIHDVTDRRLAEQQLKASEACYRELSQQFQALFDSIPDAVFLRSPELRTLFANQGAAAMLKRPLPTIIGRTCDDLGWGPHQAEDECPVRRSLRSGKTEEERFTLADGKIIEVRAIPIRNDAGEISQAIELVRDISQTVQMQAELVRAGQLAALGELAAGVAHEINNPVNGIINYAKILGNLSRGDARREDLAERIIREGDRVAAIVRNLLSFARDRQESRSPVAVRELIEDSLALIQAQLERDGIAFEMQLPGDLPQVMAIKHQLQQVLLNVLSNARYALNQRYPSAHPDKRLVFEGRLLQVEGSPRIRMHLIDFGTGIVKEILDQIFNPFFTTKPLDQGTGLGLSISRGIVQDHGGSLTIESMEGRGTTVIVELPAMH